MKELSIEEKASRYNEAIKRIENIKTGKCETTFMFSEGLFEYIFSELKESEDERIRKELISLFQDCIDGVNHRYNGSDSRRWLDWLEKQGEQPPAVIIPKFRIGDEIKTANEESLIITKIDEKGYWSEELFICDFDEECVWDLVEQKTAWSEEDNINYKRLLYFLDGGILMQDHNIELSIWMESLKERVQSQTAWKPSDAQMIAIQESIGIVGELTPRGECLKELLEQLKKLKG